MIKAIKFIKFSLISILCGHLVACVPDVSHHGYNFEHFDIKLIKVGQTSRNEIISQMGTPTTQADFGDKAMYYISSKTERVVFFQPRIIEQNVIVMHFDEKDILSSMTELTLDDAKRVVFSENLTEIKGNTLSPMQQIMTNIGKFNKSGRDVR